MKKIAFLILATFIFMLNSCNDEAEVYEGNSPALHFNKGVRGEAIVNQGTGSTTVNIDFGTIQAVSGASQVKLVVDTSVSTAVEGTDFQIVNQNVTVNPGQLGAQFQVKLLEATATVEAKLIVFKLQSSSIANATFDQTYVLQYTKACAFSMTPFSGTYKVVNDSWEDYVAGDLITVQPGPAANQFKILATNNTYISNSATAYMLVTVQNNGNVTLTSNQPFNYGGSLGAVAVTGTGKVNFCTGVIDINPINFGGNSGYRFTLAKN